MPDSLDIRGTGKMGFILDNTRLPRSGNYESFVVQNSHVDGATMIEPQIPPGHSKGENIRSTMVVPAGTTTGTNSAYGYYVRNDSTADAVGQFGTCIQNADNGTCWASNPTIIDHTANGVTTKGIGRKLVGSELDVQVTSPHTIVSGYNCTGSSAVQPAGADCFQVGDIWAAKPGVNKWTNAVSIGTGTAKTGIHHGAYNLQGANTGSIPDQWLFRDRDDLIRAVTTQASGQGGFSIGRLDLANGVTIIPAAAGQHPSVQAYGSDQNTGLVFKAQGAAHVVAQSLLSAQRGFYAATSAQFAVPVRLQSYKVSALPDCNEAIIDSIAAVVDGNTSVYRGALTGGGTTRTLAYCDGTTWTAH